MSETEHLRTNHASVSQISDGSWLHLAVYELCLRMRAPQPVRSVCDLCGSGVWPFIACVLLLEQL